MGVIRSLVLLVTGALGGAGAAAYVLRSVPPPAVQENAGVSTGNAPRRPLAEIPPATRVVGVDAAGGSAGTAAGTTVETAAGTAGAAEAEQWKQVSQALQKRLQEMDVSLAELRAELTASKTWQARLPSLAQYGKQLANQPPFKAAAAEAAMQAQHWPRHGVECQDLTSINGIGSAYEQLLYKAGVGTFWELAYVSDTEFDSFLNLTELQRTRFDGERIRAQARQLAADTNTVGLLWQGPPPDDLEPIKGIGKVFEQALYDAGIRTYSALAAASVDDILALLPKTAVQPDVASWIEQAKALAGKG